jgi:hypothetical protein
LTTGTYYVSQTNANCESARTPVSVTVTIVNAPTAQAQTFCQSGTVADLVATGSQLKWYAAATGGSQLASTTALTTGTYYVSQTNANCESARTPVSVTVTIVNAPTAQAQTFCQSGTVADLVATGSQLKWYAAATGGSQLASTTALTTGTYYVSQTNANCESARTPVSVVVNAVNAPTGNATQSFSQGATIANLVATGSNLAWFASQANALANTNALSASTVLVNGTTYYAMQTVNNCRSNLPLAVTVTVTLSNDEVTKLSFTMYPNPASDIVNIEMETEVKIVEVYSIHGQRLQSVTTKTFYLDNLPQGVYLVRVEDVFGNVSSQKLIKK